MANGIYGTKKPAVITSDDVDIFYHYRPTRSSDSADFTSFKKLDSKYLVSSTYKETTSSDSVLLPGIYDLRLPIDIFGKVGFYTIYIKPKELLTRITAVSNLAAYPEIRGIILNTNTLTNNLGNNDELVGYRVEYFDDDNNRLSTHRLITSNNRCEPVAQNLTSSLSTNIKYAFNDSSNLTFCTLTPSSSASFKPNSSIFIGDVNQKIALINTKFNPVMLDVEISEHDIDTISTMLEGTQLRNLDKSMITTFDDKGGIYHQAIYGNVVDGLNGTHHDYKIKRESDIVDETEILTDIKDSL